MREKKKLIMINGTMGVGKTTICKLLQNELQQSVWLDGDWCWMMNPWIINEENKAMVLRNITCLLSSYLENTTFQHIIFCWVLHQESIIQSILQRLSAYDYELYRITLICEENELRKRMKNDKRSSMAIEASVQRIDLYEKMQSIKIRTDQKTCIKIVQEIKEMVGASK